MMPVYPQPGVTVTMVPKKGYTSIGMASNMQLMNTPQSEIERCGQAVMKGTQRISVERIEDCCQCYWDYRDVSYDSHLGSHKIKRFQPNFINFCLCWPLKMCCCSFTIPPYVSNDLAFNEGIEIKFANRYHGFITAKGIPLGTLTLEDRSCRAQICFGQQPRVIIQKSATNETMTMRADDSICQIFTEDWCGCCVKQKEMHIEKDGGRLYASYSRSCGQACFNVCTCNSHFFNKLDVDFSTFIKSDADKVLLYGAFLFLQENTNRFRGCCC